MPDQVKITILEDGTIKVETGKISAANHLNAETFLREMSKLAAGQASVRSVKGLQQQAQTNDQHVTQ